MKKLIILVLLAACFLGGYCLGHTPGSPDLDKPIVAIWRWARKKLGTLGDLKADAPARQADRSGTGEDEGDPHRYAPGGKPGRPPT